MTDGRIDGRFIPEVHHYHVAHPTYHYDRDLFRDDEPSYVEAAAAVTEADRDDSPLVTGGDVS